MTPATASERRRERYTGGEAICRCRYAYERPPREPRPCLPPRHAGEAGGGGVGRRDGTPTACRRWKRRRGAGRPARLGRRGMGSLDPLRVVPVSHRLGAGFVHRSGKGQKIVTIE